VLIALVIYYLQNIWSSLVQKKRLERFTPAMWATLVQNLKTKREEKNKNKDIHKSVTQTEMHTNTIIMEIVKSKHTYKAYTNSNNHME